MKRLTSDKRRRWAAAAGAISASLTGAGTAALVGAPAQAAQVVPAALGSPAAAAGAPGAAAAAPGAAAAAGPLSGFQPVSVTFVSLTRGWALGTVPCAPSGRCVALAGTTDAGMTWSARPVPAQLAALADRKQGGFPVLNPGTGSLNVRFADVRDGWIFGGIPNGTSFPPLLWATHDGGASWQRQPVLPGMAPNFGGALDVEAARGVVYALVPGAHGAVLDWAPVDRNYWRPASTPALPWPAGGAQPTGSIVLQGNAGWVIEGNDRGVSGSARLLSGRTWVPWSPPCANVGNSYALPAAASATDLVAVCQMGGFAYPLSKSAPPGATIGSSWLYFSVNGGLSSSAGPEIWPNGKALFSALASPAPGTVLAGRSSSTNQMIASFDGGRNWSVAAQGWAYYIGFTSPHQGVALLQSMPTGKAGASTWMIMSFDGGHHWRRVTF